MDHLCPICQRKLTAEDERNEITDYHCFPPPNDHHFSKRIKNDQVQKIKIRLSPDGNKLYLKINFDEGYSQVWTRPDDESSRIKINHVFEPDLSDLNALQQKLRTYLIFS